MRRTSAAVTVLAATVLALTACGTTEAAPPRASAGPPAEPAAPEVARLGATGSTCPMPVDFGLAESYTAKAVRMDPGELLAELAQRGPLTMVCEIDAKPAGHIGFLRVWTGAGDQLRPALTAFAGPDALEPVFTELTVGGRPGLEVVYRTRNQLDEETIDPERAFAVATAQGITAVSLDSFDSEEHDAIRPAYELAKQSLRTAG